MTLSISLAVLLFVVLASTTWGPGHHLEYAERIWRRRREHLPRDVAQLISEQRRAYFYGNLAADIINMKAYGGHKNHCHRWTIIDEMRSRATSASEHAFIAGYLSHLAADTIAHNHFVPYHLARYAWTKGLGHLYWEMNADRWIPEKRWSIVTELKEARELDSMDELINAAVPRKALSMGTNKLIFNHLLLVSERRSWRRGMENLHPISKVQLHKGFLELFQEAAVERVRLALHPRGFASLLHVDTNGKEAQMQAMQWRKETLARYPAGAERDARGEKMARHFLLGMQSPPTDIGNERKPMWD